MWQCFCRTLSSQITCSLCITRKMFANWQHLNYYSFAHINAKKVIQAISSCSKMVKSVCHCSIFIWTAGIMYRNKSLLVLYERLNILIVEQFSYHNVKVTAFLFHWTLVSTKMLQHSAEYSSSRPNIVWSTCSSWLESYQKMADQYITRHPCFATHHHQTNKKHQQILYYFHKQNCFNRTLNTTINTSEVKTRLKCILCRQKIIAWKASRTRPLSVPICQ